MKSVWTDIGNITQHMIITELEIEYQTVADFREGQAQLHAHGFQTMAVTNNKLRVQAYYRKEILRGV